MKSDLSRRNFLTTTGAAVAAAAGAVTAQAADDSAAEKPIKIIAVCGSPRPGKSTAASLQVCLDAAKAVDPDGIEVELIELAGMKMNGSMAAGIPLEPGQRDDFPPLVPKLADPRVAGIIIGSPVYYGNMTSLTKAFLERCTVFRKDYSLSGKVAGVLAVGGGRNGGQELTIQSIQAVLFCHEMLLVGDGRPTSHRGGTVWNSKEFKGDVTKDEIGMATVKNLGRRVAEVALRVASAAK